MLQNREQAAYGLATTLPYRQLPIAWRVQFPKEISKNVISASNPKGAISNSDLEMMGMLLVAWLILKTLVDLRHTHVWLGCDNTPSVAWASCLLATKAPVAARILRILTLHMMACQASPLMAASIPGIFNTMAMPPHDHSCLTLAHKHFCHTSLKPFHFHRMHLGLPANYQWP